MKLLKIINWSIDMLVSLAMILEGVISFVSLGLWTPDLYLRLMVWQVRFGFKYRKWLDKRNKK